MKGKWFYIWALLAIVVIAVIVYFIWKAVQNSGSEGDKGLGSLFPGTSKPGNGTPSDSGTGGVDGTIPPPVVPSAKTLNDFLGMSVYAKNNNTKVRFADDITQVARTYKKGQYIGKLGKENNIYTSNIFCDNTPGWWRINGTGIKVTRPILFTQTDPICGVVMEESVLRDIFNV